MDDRIFSSVVDDVVYVTFERRAVDAVRSEQLLGLARVVKLLDEEVRDCVMRQVRDLRSVRKHQEKIDP